MNIAPMDFSQTMLTQVIELTLLLGTYVTDQEHRVDLDKFATLEAIRDTFHAVLTACGDCLSLSSLKLVWKAVASTLATVESEASDSPILTHGDYSDAPWPITTSYGHGPSQLQLFASTSP